MKKTALAILSIGAALTTTHAAEAQRKPGVRVIQDGVTTVYATTSWHCSAAPGTYCGKHTRPDATGSVVFDNGTPNELRVASWIVGIPFYAYTVMDNNSVFPGETRTISANDPTPGRALATVWCQKGLGEPTIAFDESGSPAVYCR